MDPFPFFSLTSPVENSRDAYSSIEKVDSFVLFLIGKIVLVFLSGIILAVVLAFLTCYSDLCSFSEFLQDFIIKEHRTLDKVHCSIY